jgi:hypothetical protein
MGRNKSWHRTTAPQTAKPVPAVPLTPDRTGGTGGDNVPQVPHAPQITAAALGGSGDQTTPREARSELRINDIKNLPSLRSMADLNITRAPEEIDLFVSGLRTGFPQQDGTAVSILANELTTAESMDKLAKALYDEIVKLLAREPENLPVDTVLPKGRGALKAVESNLFKSKRSGVIRVRAALDTADYLLKLLKDTKTSRRPTSRRRGSGC